MIAENRKKFPPCPVCGSTKGTTMREEISTMGWVVTLVLAVCTCLLLAPIGFFIKEKRVYCKKCWVRRS